MFLAGEELDHLFRAPGDIEQSQTRPKSTRCGNKKGVTVPVANNITNLKWPI